MRLLELERAAQDGEAGLSDHSGQDQRAARQLPLQRRDRRNLHGHVGTPADLGRAGLTFASRMRSASAASSRLVGTR